MSKITWTFAFLCFLISINAQNFKAGFQVGTNFAVQSQIGDYYNNSDIRTGLHAGIFGNYSLNKSISLQTEIDYDQKGSKSETIKNSFDYLTIPLLFNYSLGKSLQTPLTFTIYAGPYVGFLLHADSETNSSEINETKDLKDQSKKEEYGLISGFGIKYPAKKGNLLFDIRLGLGLSPFDKNDNEAKNKYIGLTMGYEF